MPRFVVLHHRVGSQPSPEHAGPHFDWMFEADGVLLTWATEPITSFEEPIELAATKLADHRLHYLNYEGEISGDRGTVQRVIAGTYTASEITEEKFDGIITWTDQQNQSQSRRIEIYRSLSPICLSDDETRGAWGLRLGSCR